MLRQRCTGRTRKTRLQTRLPKLRTASPSWSRAAPRAHLQANASTCDLPPESRVIAGSAAANPAREADVRTMSRLASRLALCHTGSHVRQTVCSCTIRGKQKGAGKSSEYVVKNSISLRYRSTGSAAPPLDRPAASRARGESPPVPPSSGSPFLRASQPLAAAWMRTAAKTCRNPARQRNKAQQIGEPISQNSEAWLVHVRVAAQASKHRCRRGGGGCSTSPDAHCPIVAFHRVGGSSKRVACPPSVCNADP